MIVDVSYYKLREKIEMNDSHFIDVGQKLVKLKEEDCLILFETFDDTAIKRIFWAGKNKVDFLETKQEEKTEEQISQKNKEIFENWL